MPNWDDLSNKIKNYSIWDLYRHSLEWLIYILDIGIIENKSYYIDFCVNVINSWLDNFRIPDKYFSHLIWCDHAVSCRIIVFLYIHNVLKYTKYLQTINFNLVNEIKTHANYLYSWIKNNHAKVHNHILIACISITYYNLYFNLKNSTMLNLTLNIIEKYMESNFTDGINIENSPGYQFHVLVYLIRFFYFMTKTQNNELLTQKMKEILNESILYLDIFKRNNLTVPVIGDSNLTLDIFASYEEVYNNLDIMIRFLENNNIIKKNNLIKKNFTSIIKEKTGYIFFLEKDIQIIIRSNPIIYNWHTHNDQLSINYFRDGIDWITDVGSYPDKRDYCISRMAHNIILRNMENKDTIKDVYKLEIVNNKHIILIMENDLFIHKRQFIWLDINNFTLIDDITNKNILEESVFNQIFHLNNNINIEQNNNKILLKHKNNTLNIIQNTNTELKIYNGSEEPFIGWLCYNASKMEKTNTLVFNSYKSNKANFITNFEYS
jgi:hypothetical protein